LLKAGAVVPEDTLLVRLAQVQDELSFVPVFWHAVKESFLKHVPLYVFSIDVKHLVRVVVSPYLQFLD